MSDSNSWELIERQRRYQGFFALDVLRLRHSLFRGGWSGVVTRELLERGDSVAVMLYDPRQDRVVLIEQFRVGAVRAAAQNPWLWEIVAGVIDGDESPAQVAQREAMEEAGCSILQLLLIGKFYASPGGSTEQTTLYCGIVDSTNVGGIYGLAEEQEDIRVQAVAFVEAFAMLERGEIASVIPVIGLQWLALNRERLRADLQNNAKC